MKSIGLGTNTGKNFEINCQINTKKDIVFEKCRFYFLQDSSLLWFDNRFSTRSRFNFVRKKVVMLRVLLLFFLSQRSNPFFRFFSHERKNRRLQLKKPLLLQKKGRMTDHNFYFRTCVILRTALERSVAEFCFCQDFPFLCLVK